MKCVFSMVALLAAGLAAPVSAQSDEERKLRCEAQTEIVTRLMELRSEGAREGRAIRKVIRERKEGETPYADAVSPLAGWIYTLDEDAEPSEVAEVFRTSCEGYKTQG